MLVNKTTNARIWEHDFRAAFPNTSFPAVLTDVVLGEFDHAVLVYPPQPTATAGFKVVDSGQAEVNGEWQVTWTLEPETQEELARLADEFRADVVVQVQARLDEFAKTRNYDSILSAATYATSSVPKFAAEGQYAVNIRDLTWNALYSLLADVLAGTVAMPSSYAEIEILLPTPSWPT